MRGDEHNFLGMNIKFKDKKVKISTEKHIHKATNMFMDDITMNEASSETSYSFKTREAAKLSEKKLENFHSVVESLLFVSRRCRLYIHTAVDFLCKKVVEPDKDEWKKLKCVLQYLRGTIDLVLMLGADDITKINSWVNASYGIHSYCNIHTGGEISWGWGVLLSKC